TDVFYCEGVPLLSVGLAAAVNRPWSERRPEARFDEAIPKGAWDPRARLAAMAEDGLDAEIVYPTMTLRMFALEDGAFMHACFQAYNAWVADFCRAAPDRLKGIGVI